MTKRNWVIQNIRDHELFWANTLGWVDWSMKDRFTLSERYQFNLPMEGRWVKL